MKAQYALAALCGLVLFVAVTASTAEDDVVDIDDLASDALLHHDDSETMNDPSPIWRRWGRWGGWGGWGWPRWGGWGGWGWRRRFWFDGENDSPASDDGFIFDDDDRQGAPKHGQKGHRCRPGHHANDDVLGDEDLESIDDPQGFFGGRRFRLRFGFRRRGFGGRFGGGRFGGGRFGFGGRFGGGRFFEQDLDHIEDDIHDDDEGIGMSHDDMEDPIIRWWPRPICRRRYCPRRPPRLPMRD